MSEENAASAVPERPRLAGMRPAHRLRAMTGRDRHEKARSATNLELFFDLTFVVAFSFAGAQLSHYLAEGHYKTAIIGFCFTTGAAIWAWINFSWFTSAFDTDDWLFRVTTLVQTGGVCILALGITPVFTSIDTGNYIDNRVIVLGYVVMRIALVAEWTRVAIQSPTYRRAALTYLAAIIVAQIGWIITAIMDITLLAMIAVALTLYLVEFAGPVRAERTNPTPWHPHHIAERYGLLTIITLGEGIVGTITALQAVISAQGWSADTAILGAAGVAITFSMWWIYFSIPTAEALHTRPEKSFAWGYGHMIVFMSIAAFGGGLHVIAYYIEHHAHIGPGAVAAAAVVPLGIFLVFMLVVRSYLVAFDAISTAITAIALAVLIAAVILSAHGASIVTVLIVATVAPFLVVFSDELGSSNRTNRQLASNAR